MSEVVLRPRHAKAPTINSSILFPDTRRKSSTITFVRYDITNVVFIPETRELNGRFYDAAIKTKQ